MRRPGWEIRLNDVIEAAAFRPFVWGEHDCGTFAVDCIEAVTGERPWPLRRSYRTPRGWLRAMREIGITDVAQAGDLYFERRHVRAARRGDAVAVQAQEGLACGIVDLTGACVVAMGLNGLLRMPTDRAVAAWSVG